MSKLEKLIKELCPEGVEYRKIKDKYTRLKGTAITAGKMKQIHRADGDIRIFAGGKTVIDTYEKDINNANITRTPSVLVQSRGIIDVIFYDEPFTFKNEMWAYTAENIVFVKYLYYVLKNNIQGFRNLALGMGSMPQISLKVTEEFKIPIPPLPVQEEVVRILDNFTELTVELTARLTAELTARHKQYEYYRDELLTFDDGVEWKTISEVCMSISAGGDLPANYIKGQLEPTIHYPYPVYSNGTKDRALYGFSDTYKIDNDAVTVSARGTIGFHAVRKAKFTPIVRLITLIANKKIITTKYLNYSLYVAGIEGVTTGIPSLTVPMIKKFKIPVPSLAEQERIVAILDKFDALVNDINIGIPAEIEARQKQYEYYRDKLLQFKELSEV